MSGLSFPQTLPAEYLNLLSDLLGATRTEPAGSEARSLAYRKFVGYVTVLEQAGWRKATIGPAVGITRQGLSHLTSRYEPLLQPWPPVEHAPRPIPRVRVGRLGPPPSPSLPKEIRLRLGVLRRESEGCRGPYRGTAKANRPEWRAGAEFAAIVHALITDGPYTFKGIARDLGLAPLAVHNRLARHGYKPFAPSQTPAKEHDPRARAS